MIYGAKGRVGGVGPAPLAQPCTTQDFYTIYTSLVLTLGS